MNLCHSLVSGGAIHIQTALFITFLTTAMVKLIPFLSLVVEWEQKNISFFMLLKS